ncbi:MAG: helix-turn-helix domain-containing protein [Acetobacteraceae bacterium]|nr:helix-turn-helix domain-containing protein [Acetobacteraceae bacterium]
MLKVNRTQQRFALQAIQVQSASGWSREAAAEACAMDRQTLRDWVHRYNESGLTG